MVGEKDCQMITSTEMAKCIMPGNSFVKVSQKTLLFHTFKEKVCQCMKMRKDKDVPEKQQRPK